MAIRTATGPSIRGAQGSSEQSAAPGRSTKASVALWTIQGLLAATFLMAGVSKLVMSAGDLADQSDLPVLFLRFIGVCETAGALGLILPGIVGIKRGLTPLAAAGLVVVVIGATTITAAGGDALPALFPCLVGVLAATVSYKRWQRA